MWYRIVSVTGSSIGQLSHWEPFKLLKWWVSSTGLTYKNFYSGDNMVKYNGIFVTVHKMGRDGQNKMGGMLSVNTSTVENPFCKSMKDTDTVCRYCYARKQENSYPSVRRRYSLNGELLSSEILPFEKLPAINAAFCRLSAFGELLNDNHFINLLNLCRKNPFVRFTLWTKRTDIVNKHRELYEFPSNLRLVYSNPIVDSIIKTPEGWDGVFNVVTEDNPMINCRGRCMDCLRCYARDEIGCIVEKLK